mmetsp:Transcript_63316/g.125158  ORF Transcript_63316/g.125158 Transcript_63316/m.125158 type:complete len:231 (-) Transcript_63316:187-879(-)
MVHALCTQMTMQMASTVSSRLVIIDMDNQKAEAALRKTLVHAEEYATLSSSRPPTNMQSDPKDGDLQLGGRERIAESVQVYIRTLIGNYKDMFLNLIPIDFWNVLYSRTVFAMPYLLAAPKIFEPHSQVNLGDLQMLRLVFFDVFFSLNAFAVHWPKINELRATVRRLEQFEERIRAQRGQLALSPPRSLLFRYLHRKAEQPMRNGEGESACAISSTVTNGGGVTRTQLV